MNRWLELGGSKRKTAPESSSQVDLNRRIRIEQEDAAAGSTPLASTNKRDSSSNDARNTDRLLQNPECEELYDPQLPLMYTYYTQPDCNSLWSFPAPPNTNTNLFPPPQPRYQDPIRPSSSESPYFNLPKHSRSSYSQPFQAAGPSYQAGPSSHQVGPSNTQAALSSRQPGPSSHQAGPSNTKDGYGGGPSDRSLLVSYDTHVAKKIWENQNENKVLRVEKRGTLKDWNDRLRNVDQQWVKIAKRSKIMHLQNLQFQQTNEALVSAFVERWHPETNSFHLPGAEISITLHDVHCILGFRLDGIKPSLPSDVDLKMFIAQNYNVDDQALKQLVQGNSINIKRWRALLFDMIDYKGDPTLIAAGYLCELVGSTLFIDSTSDGIPLNALYLVSNPDFTHEYSWSVATLACLYRNLGMASRAEVAQIGGCLFVLHNFIWRYFPALRGHLNYDITRLPGENYKSNRGRNRAPGSLQYYRRILDHTRVEDVNWMPWRDHIDFDNSTLALSRYRGTLTCLHIKEAYHPERLARQYGWHQSIPLLDVIKPINYKRPLKIDFNNHYSVEYSVDDDLWDGRRFHCLMPMGVPASPVYSMDAEYLDWHMKHTHPYILCTSVTELQVNARMPQPELDIYARMELIKAVAKELQAYRDDDGKLGEFARRITDICFRAVPPPPIPPRATRRRSPTSDVARHNDA